MNAAMLALLCDPVTHAALELKTQMDEDARSSEYLVNPKSGQRFFVRKGIPIFLQDGEVTGANQRYQASYDRFARLYDLSSWLYSCWKGTSTQARLREYLDKLEIKGGDRVLEVSVGTGRNLRYLPQGVQYVGLDLSWGMLQQCQRNQQAIAAPVALVPSAMQELEVADIAGGDMYCLTFRKPRE